MKTQYEITIKGRLPLDWSEWYDVTEISYHDNETRFKIIVTDQACLIGIMNRLQSLNIRIVSMNPMDNITL